MKSSALCAILAIPLLAGACAKAPANNAAGSVNAAAVSMNDGDRAAPAATTAANAAAANLVAPAAGGLSAYVGKTTSDRVEGVTFVDRPEVRSAVTSLVSDSTARNWILNPNTTQAPIELRGAKLYSSACEPHNCGPHDWTISIGPDGSGAEICYHDDARDSAHSHWYAVGRPPETRPGNCVPD